MQWARAEHTGDAAHLSTTSCHSLRFILLFTLLLWLINNITFALTSYPQAPQYLYRWRYFFFFSDMTHCSAPLVRGLVALIFNVHFSKTLSSVKTFLSTLSIRLLRAKNTLLYTAEWNVAQREVPVTLDTTWAQVRLSNDFTVEHIFKSFRPHGF